MLSRSHSSTRRWQEIHWFGFAHTSWLASIMQIDSIVDERKHYILVDGRYSSANFYTKFRSCCNHEIQRRLLWFVDTRDRLWHDSSYINHAHNSQPTCSLWWSCVCQCSQHARHYTIWTFWMNFQHYLKTVSHISLYHCQFTVSKVGCITLDEIDALIRRFIFSSTIFIVASSIFSTHK